MQTPRHMARMDKPSTENDEPRLSPAQREAMVRIIVKAALWGWDAHEAGAQRQTVEQTATTCVIPPGPWDPS